MIANGDFFFQVVNMKWKTDEMLFFNTDFDVELNVQFKEVNAFHVHQYDRVSADHVLTIRFPRSHKWVLCL